MVMRKASPLVSIGVPTFNRPEDLRRCLKELCSQTYANIEIIVSDNASINPVVKQIGQEACAQDPRVRYFRQAQNIGPQRNFQFVLDQAKGEYFIWAADDDRRSPRFVEVLLTQLEADQGAVFSFCRFEDRDREGDVVHQRVDCMNALRTMSYRHSVLRQICFFLTKEGGGKPHAIYGMIRRRALTNFSWPEFIEAVGWHGSDVLLMAKLLSKGRLALSEEVLMSITVDSVKHYDQHQPVSKLSRHLSSFMYLLQYSLRHVQMASPFASVCIALLMPLKFAEIVGEQFMRPLWKRVKAVFQFGFVR